MGTQVVFTHRLRRVRSWLGAWLATWLLACLPIAMLAACSGSSHSSDPGPASDTAGSPIDFGDASAGPTLRFLQPEQNATVSGVQPVELIVEPAAWAARTIRLEVLKLPLVDQNPDPGELLGDWDTTVTPDGPYRLLGVAEFDTGATLNAERDVIVWNADWDQITGTVQLVGPVSGAAVSLFVADELLLTERLVHTTTTDASGAFVFDVQEALESPFLLVRASGSSATFELPNGEVQHLAPDTPLALLVDSPASSPASSP